MAGANISPVEDQQPQPFNATKLEPAKKRKRSRSPLNSAPKRHDHSERSKSKDYDSPSNPLKHRRTPSPQPEPRKQKRPGQRARIPDAEVARINQKKLEREKELEQQLAKQGIHDAVKQHYNSVPERGREWRKTDSRIKGLRSFNNWVKSTLIQKFSPNEDYTPGASVRGGMTFAEGPPPDKILVLDIGCGKGGDLGKWQQAPQKVDLYVGLDPADVSIQQARERYQEMRHRGGGGRGGRGRGGRDNRPSPNLFHAQIYAKDCFGESIEDVEIIRRVGFSARGGPGGGGGFDVVSMMFCMHYAFESEAKAKQMLANVAGALKKGGRLIGCIPNSDVIGEKVRQWNARHTAKLEGKKSEGNKLEGSKLEGNELETEDNGKEVVLHTTEEDGREEGEADEADETAEWKSNIYRVRFPGPTPADGIFRNGGPFGHKYNYFLHEAVEEVPEYVVPFPALRSIAENYNLELQYHKTFGEVWEAEKDDPTLGPLSERMGVRGRNGGPLLVSEEEMEAANFYSAFCFYKV